MAGHLDDVGAGRIFLAPAAPPPTDRCAANWSAAIVWHRHGCLLNDWHSWALSLRHKVHLRRCICNTLTNLCLVFVFSAEISDFSTR